MFTEIAQAIVMEICDCQKQLLGNKRKMKLGWYDDGWMKRGGMFCQCLLPFWAHVAKSWQQVKDSTSE